MARKDLLSNLLTAVLVLCALAITGLVIRREFRPGLATSTRAPVREVDDWASYAEAGHLTGPATAPVKIVEFSDFQCPFCRRLAPRLDSLRVLSRVPVAIVYRHFPLDSHPYALAAARASECAADQGRFQEMHNSLFRESGAFGQKAWSAYARDAGVRDAAAFARCVEGDGGASRIRRDMAAGGRLGVAATPTLLVNRFRIEGAPPLDTLLAYVARAAREAGQK
jgi:protein-disulfide isomerase